MNEESRYRSGERKIYPQVEFRPIKTYDLSVRLEDLSDEVAAFRNEISDQGASADVLANLDNALDQMNTALETVRRKAETWSARERFPKLYHQGKKK